MEDHYATLRVRASASAEEIERAYRRLARTNHPDLLRQASPETQRRAEEVLKRVNRAHRVLGDRERRRDYDRRRRGVVPPAAASPPGDTPQRPPTVAPRPVVERTTHWGSGGPIDIEWEVPPPRAPRPATDLFSLGRLLRYAAAIILFAALLAIIWQPGLGRQPATTPTAPIVATTTGQPTPAVPVGSPP